jgi:large subunit ribosomal protein L31e
MLMAEDVVLTVPLKKIFYLPRYKRSKKAVRMLKSELKRKLKVDQIKISKELNELLWSHGDSLKIRKIKVLAKIDKENSVAVLDVPGKKEETEEAKQQ